MATGQIGAVLVPLFGWQVMFLIGGIPGLIVTWLLLRLPESPRWLITQGPSCGGRSDRARDGSPRRSPGHSSAGHRPAGRASSRLPPPRAAPWRDLLGPPYRRRTLTVWTLWSCAYFITNGLNNWMPTLYNQVYHLNSSAVAPRRHVDQRRPGDRSPRMRLSHRSNRSPPLDGRLLPGRRAPARAAGSCERALGRHGDHRS